MTEGLMTWSTEAHAGDVNTITELRPGLIYTAGSDCRVRPHRRYNIGSLCIWQNATRYED